MYVVRWKRTALERVAELWLDSADRNRVTDAVAEIDRLLAIKPSAVGESRSEEVRILFEPPLGVFYEFDESTRTVWVLKVWTF